MGIVADAMANRMTGEYTEKIDTNLLNKLKKQGILSEDKDLTRLEELAPKMERVHKDKKAISIIKIPFSSRERLKRIHPGRLINKLRSAGCIQKLPPSTLHSDLMTS